MTITQEEAALLLPSVRCFFDLLVRRYDEGKYPPAVYEELRTIFRTPGDVQSADIHLALRWKYGKLYAENLPENQVATIERITRRWQYFEKASGNEEKLDALREPNVQSYDFVSRAFLVHLAAPEEVPIVDRFNHRAVRCLLGIVRPAFNLGYLPKTYDDIVLIRCFIERLIDVWPDTSPSHETVDRFLMMFGKNVAPPY